MSLSGQQREKLKEALIDAFPWKSSLEQMLSEELDKNLDAIVGGKDLQEIVFNLIKTAVAQGWIEDLICAARRKNPGNPKLQAIVQTFPPALQELKEPTTPSLETTATFIDWHEVCRAMLSPQNRITSNVLMQDESAKKERKQIYVPLALVQRTKTDKRNKEDFSPDAGTHLYEPQYETQQRFDHEAFLSQILERGSGKTKGKQIAIIGEPGAGKTTLLQAIADWVLEKDLGLPIWISLADLGRNGTLTDIKTYILNIWLEQAIEPTQLTQERRDNLTNQIQKGRVWLLLDGVDEISGSHQPLEEISRQLIGWISSSRVVLTCRLNVWQADRHALESFETYRLLDFDYPQQVHQFIDNWFVEDSEKGERLKKELDLSRRVRLRDLVQIPLRLTLLCSIWRRKEGNLPQTKAGLYAQFVQQFYIWKQNRFPTNKKEQRELNKAFGRLALKDISEGGSRFRLREGFIIEELDDPDDKDSLFYKALQLGWLNHVGIAAESDNDEKVYAFYHATFEEYFAALAVEDWHYFLNHVPEKPEQGTYRIFEPLWKEVILLWLGREDIKEDQKQEFIQALVNFQDRCGQWHREDVDKGFYEYQAYFLAAAGIAEFQYCSQVDEIVNQIVTWGFGYFNNQSRQWKRFNPKIGEYARSVLVETQRERAIVALDNLIAKFQDGSTFWQAADSLGKIAPNNKTAINALVNLIANSQFESIRRQAADSLGKIAPNNPTAINVLVNLIANSQFESIRRQATDSLGEIAPNNPTAINVLVNLIANSQSESIRRQAADSLGKIAPNNTNAINALVKLIAHSQSESIRRQAIDSLGEIALNNLKAINTLVKLIAHSQSESIRRQAIDSLGEIAPNNTNAINTLENLIAHSQSESIRRQAADSLGKITPNNTNAINTLENLITHSQSESTCLLAADSLVQIAPNNKTAINALVNLIANSQDERTRRLAAFSLGKIALNNKTAINALVNLIANSQDEFTRRVAAGSLGKIASNNTNAINALVNLIAHSQDERTRRRAADSLVQIAQNNTNAINALVNLIAHSQSESTCRQAIDSLQGLLTKSKKMAAVVTALKNRFSSNEVYKVLWHCSQTMTYPAFYQAWHDESNQT